MRISTSMFIVFAQRFAANVAAVLHPVELYRVNAAVRGRHRVGERGPRPTTVSTRPPAVTTRPFSTLVPE